MDRFKYFYSSCNTEFITEFPVILGIQIGRLKLIKELLESALSNTEDMYNDIAKEVLKSLYNDAYEYPGFYLPLGSVHKKIKIYCPVHDIVIVSTFYDHVVPIRKSFYAIECPQCIVEGNYKF